MQLQCITKAEEQWIPSHMISRLKPNAQTSWRLLGAQRDACSKVALQQHVYVHIQTNERALSYLMGMELHNVGIALPKMQLRIPQI